MAQNPVFEIEFEETVAGFAINPVGADPFTKAEVNEGAPADTPIAVIRNNQPWDVSFRWRTSGGTTTLMVGDWKLDVYLLSLNSGGGPVLAGNKVVAHVPSDPHDYTETVPVAAGTIPDGLYKLYVNVDFDVPGAAAAKITGFGEGPMMKFYTPS